MDVQDRGQGGGDPSSQSRRLQRWPALHRSSDTYMYCLNGISGEEVWRFYSYDVVHTAALSADGARLYCEPARSPAVTASPP